MTTVVQLTMTSCPSFQGIGDQGFLPSSVAREKGGGHFRGTAVVSLRLYYMCKMYLFIRIW